MGLTLEILFSTSLLFIIILFFKKYISSSPTNRLPPGPKGWPIVGCLPLLGTMPHVTFFNMAKRFGPVMYLKTGTNGILVISDPESAMVVLKTLEHNFLDRPKNVGALHIAYNAQDFIFENYGVRWMLYRKLSNLHLLGGKAYNDWGPIRKYEIRHLVHDMYQMSLKGEPVEVPSMVWCTMVNLISRMTLSRRLFTTCGSESNDFKHMIVELMRLTGMFGIGDFIPLLAWMDLLGIARQMKRMHTKFDGILTTLIDEHSLAIHERENNPDFMDIVMAEKGASERLELTTKNIKALLLDMFIGGTDTSVATIEWGLGEMMKNPTILLRVQQEIDQVVGKNRQLQESDIPNLPYLKAVCKETFRLHPAAPLGLPRLCTNACEVNGYYIPRNTTLLVNLWAIGRNPNVWTDPTLFNPDRFLTDEGKKIEVWGNNFELMPFGSGKRICPGIKMGVAVVEYIMGTLVHSFNWNIPHGTLLDMDEAPGLVVQKVNPLKALAIPRLHPSAYRKPSSCTSPLKLGS